MSFLKAEWRKLILANYKVEPELLKPYLPYGTELDLWQDNCYLSLVGFMFVNTKIKGVKIPFHVNFEEVNLRFYVRHLQNGEWKRGVVFIKEIVPKPAITFIANKVYKENYQTLPMKHIWFEDDSSLNVIYEWCMKDNWYKLAANCDPNPNTIQPDSEAAFITEHYWGYTHNDSTTSTEYEVTHPTWKTYPINHYVIDVDFAAVYGKSFGALSSKEPASVMLAEGSQITVENKRIIKSIL
ncbi:MAG: DUF2071 domain-containing protein [Crocinitomicaceae bacterium]|jgi:uncharacterized protein|nr:DUF2071 domain-containing protein [Crocinitomicaceae bacterium]